MEAEIRKRHTLRERRCRLERMYSELTVNITEQRLGVCMHTGGDGIGDSDDVVDWLQEMSCTRFQPFAAVANGVAVVTSPRAVGTDGATLQFPAASSLCLAFIDSFNVMLGDGSGVCSPAQAAGLCVGDVIIAVNGTRTFATPFADLMSLLRTAARPVAVTVLRRRTDTAVSRLLSVDTNAAAPVAALSGEQR